MRNNLKDFTLLYAEDEKDVQSNMIEYLESYFNTIYVASDGEEALKSYRDFKPDVAILDINMPKVSGLEIAEIIRKDDSLTRIIMLTAHSEKDLLLQAAEIDMSKYLLKPVTPYDFKEALNKVANELLNNSKKIIKFDDKTQYNISNKILTSNGIDIELAPKEKRLLCLLISKRGSCVSFEDIMAYVWEEYFDEDISKDSVKSQVNYLRKKLPQKSIENVYGRGYCLKI